MIRETSAFESADLREFHYEIERPTHRTAAMFWIGGR